MKCTRCQKDNVYKNGKNKTGQGIIQKYYCPDCGKHFQIKQDN